MKEDKNIENFFKRRLENNEFSYREEDWVQLADRLDLVDEASGGAWGISQVKLLVYGVMVLVVAFLAGWFANDLAHQASKVENEPNQEKYSNTSTEVIGPVETHIEGQEIVLSQKKPNQIKSESGRSDDQWQPIGITQNESLSVPEREVQGDAEIIGYDLIPVGSIREINLSSPPLFMLSRQRDGSLLSVNNEDPAKKKLLKRFSVGVSVSPDFNSVGIGESKTPTLLIGGRLYYEVAERLTVSGGVFFNQKKYAADGEAYNPPGGYYYTGGSTPSTIDGACRVMDVPLLMTYRLTNNKRINFSATAGVSNYFVLDEHYEFYYSNYNTYPSGEYSTKQNSQVMWGVLNFSVAIDLSLADQFVFSVEPYLKKPVKDIGWGNVDLVSIGSLLTLRYHPFR